MKINKFTLIELLIVISIIAVLAAILLPALNKAKQTARKIECLNQQKQIGLSVGMYANDHDSYIPGWCMSDTITDEKLRWATRLIPYTNHRPELWVCPASKELSDAFAMSQIRTYSQQLDANFTSSFRKVQTIGINASQLTPTDSATLKYAFIYTTQRMGRIKNPSDVIYSADATGSTGAYYNPSNPSGQLPFYTFLWPDSGSSIYPRHPNSANILFSDGHCDSVTSTTIRNWSANRWAPENATHWIAY